MIMYLNPGGYDVNDKRTTQGLGCQAGVRLVRRRGV